ncbi:hypothetical protein JL720_6595 [Aureococcus anophagefferens]|nr:hypothetical protein JL720_6595 [Aureococcus anophagefferens]
MIDEDAILHPATFLPAFSFPMIRDPTPEVSDAESEVAEVEEEEAAAEEEEEVAAEAEATGPSEADVARMKQRLEGMRLKRAMKRVSTVIFKNLILPSRMRGDGEQRGAYSGPRASRFTGGGWPRDGAPGITAERIAELVEDRAALEHYHSRNNEATQQFASRLRSLESRNRLERFERPRAAAQEDQPRAVLMKRDGGARAPRPSGTRDVDGKARHRLSGQATRANSPVRPAAAPEAAAGRPRTPRLTMRYKSTRGGVKDCGFIEAVLMGLAPDKGLLVPHSIPEVSAATLEQWKKLSFPSCRRRSSRLHRPGEISKAELASSRARPTRRSGPTRSRPSRRSAATTSLELFHGPTYAFKDVALQFLGFLFELILQKGYANGRLTIIGATSGDTGSSAIEGIRGKKGVDCFILYPNNRTSKIQEAQMCSVPDENCHAIALEDAFFDDCQKIVKTLFADQAFHKKHSLGAVNSINWARIVAQIVYYFYAQLKFDEPCHFSVPTGNFGDVLAGWYAKQMGCPCKSLTVTPSMDISVSSNFERFVYHCCGDDDKILKGLMDTFEATGAFTASPEHWEKCKAEMYAGSCQQPQILATIKKWHEKTDYVLDPHTAVGVYCAEQLKATLGPGPVVCLACAHHGKFPTSIEKAIGAATLAEVPEEKNLTDLLDLPKRKNVLVNSLDAVVDFVEAKVGGGKPAAKKAKK